MYWYIIEEEKLEAIEDYYSSHKPIGICRTAADGRAICEKLQKENVLVWEAIEFLYEKDQEWLRDNPSPHIPYEDEPKIKKWPAGIGENQITEEMRAERKATKKLIEEFRAKHGEETKKLNIPWLKSHDDFRNQLLEEYFVKHPEVTHNETVRSRIMEFINSKWDLFRFTPAENYRYHVNIITVLEAEL